MPQPPDAQPAAQQPAGKPHSNRLTLYILIAIVAAIVMALTLPTYAMSLHVGGEVFLRLLKMMVVPLVVTSVMSGILGLGDVRKLGKPGAAAVVYYLSTTVLAVTVGLIVVNIVKPGRSIDPAAMEKAAGEVSDVEIRKRIRDGLAETTGVEKDKIAEVFAEQDLPTEKDPDIYTILNNLVLMLVTDNLFLAAAETNLLPLIVFSILFAGLLTTMGERVDTVTSLVREINDALMGFIMMLMNLAPIGIFCLVAARFGEAQASGTFLAELRQIAMYMVTVLAGLGIHMLVTLPLILWIFTRRNPYRFILDMAQALLTAFSTASSSATLPVTLECATENAGVSKQSAEFVLPLGATINMDGTALYEAAAAIFIAQALGDAYDLTMTKQLIIAITATLAAIGAAGIPEAGLVTMLIVLNAVGLPLEYIGLILSVDWLLDRFRTAVNAFGDAVGSAVVDGVMPKT